MRKVVLSLFSLWLLTAGLGFFSVGYGKTFELKFVPKPPKEDSPEAKKYPAIDKLMGKSQDFTGNFNSTQRKKDVEKDPKLAEFFKLVKKEPAYTSKYPFRGVFKLGKKSFLFALDEIPQKKGKKEDKKKEVQEKPKPVYQKLYLDRNGNGDLTDDKPIDGNNDESYSYRNYTYTTFDSFTLPLDGRNGPVETPLHLQFWAQSATRSIASLLGKTLDIEHRTVYASFFTTCFREGDVQLDGKDYHAILVDQNSNGSFNDMAKLCVEKDKDKPDSKPTCKIQNGDLLYLFPKGTTEFNFDEENKDGDKTQFALGVGGFAQLDKQKFLKMQISPNGKKLTLEPYNGPLGHLSNPGKEYQIQIFHKQQKAVLSLASDKAGKIDLPPGEWLLTNYNMTLGEKKKSAEKTSADSKNTSETKDKNPTKPKKTEHEQAAEAMATKFANFFLKSMASPPIAASVTAWELNPGKSTFTIKENETTTFEFGPPYQVKVQTHVRDTKKGKLAYLSLDVTGAMEENCYISFDGKDRPKAKFVITTKDGKEVESGAFEYG